MSPMVCLLVITLSVFFTAIDHPFFKLFFSFVKLFLIYEYHCLIRDQPFNLKGGYGFLFRSEIFFRRAQELEYIFFCRAKREIFSRI